MLEQKAKALINIDLLGGEKMAVSVLKEIRDAEYEAERIEKKSISDAREIVSDTKREAYEHLESTIQDTEMKANEIMQQAKQQAHGEIVKMNVDVSRECDMIVEQAMTNLDKAVEFIVGRIVNFKWQ